MTLKEIRTIIAEERAEGVSDEEILTVFAVMFNDGTVPRGIFEMAAGELGFELSEEAKAMSDEELSANVLEKPDDK